MCKFKNIYKIWSVCIVNNLPDTFMEKKNLHFINHWTRLILVHSNSPQKEIMAMLCFPFYDILSGK